MKYSEHMDDSAMIELMEQIRAEDEAYDTMFVSADSFCGCDQCESQWIEYE